MDKIHTGLWCTLYKIANPILSVKLNLQLRRIILDTPQLLGPIRFYLIIVAGKLEVRGAR